MKCTAPLRDFFFFSSRRRHTRLQGDWSSDVCSSDLKLDESHYAAIGRLDVVMVPIDGTYTMSLDGISDITRRLRAAVGLPMHRFMTPLDDFMRRIGQQFAIDSRMGRARTLSRRTLPGSPTLTIFQGG